MTRKMDDEFQAFKNYINRLVIIASFVLAGLYGLVFYVEHVINNNHSTGLENHKILCQIVKAQHITDSIVLEYCKK